MDLVRTIQKSETSKWVAHLGKDQRYFIPPPGVPRRPFDGLIVIHNGTALRFEVANIVHHKVPLNTRVGSLHGIVVRARVRIFVQKGPVRTGRALIKGFRGIRYRPWSAVAT